ncbi:MAG: lysylphosphatidylglycerol synthase transmembrane domain-containing protein [Bacteroidales bacterium]|nr:lysylphosphatidylglycerol synthase transmembrane domain-containing protein [Bacteroidales bacterium]
MKSFLKIVIQTALPFVLGLGILWWMYRGTDWTDFFACVAHDMKWGWMLLSLAFGILPQLARAWRWKMALEPLGEQPRRSTCEDAIFLSYAASLVVPRVGEVTRCGTLKKFDGVSFTKSLGTVVTERLVDSALMLLFTGLAFLAQLPMFLSFLHKTGTNLGDILHRFTGTGYLVTFICLVAVLLTAAILMRRYALFRKGKDMLREVFEGVLSLRHVGNLPLYLFYSVLIWVGYFLHFYIAFFCFDFTAQLSLGAAFLIFCVGTFAVLVPTPNGAGPWHFAVKTMLVLYGVAEPQAILFALVVHTIQTALVVALGCFGWLRVNLSVKH